MRVKLAGRIKSMTLSAIFSVAFITLVGQAVFAQSFSPPTPCGELLKMSIEETTIASATEAPGGSPLKGVWPAPTAGAQPAHCIVRGEVGHHTGADGAEYGARFELRLPGNWNGRFLFQGGAGLNGFLFPAVGWVGSPLRIRETALARGYAVVSTDGGHQARNANDGSFGADPQAYADYAYRSTKVVSDVAKNIVAKYYGRAAKYSYFLGCSNGGREGMMTTQRYPDSFDGVIAGAPAFNLTGAAVAGAWNAAQVAAIAPKDAQGKPALAQALSDADLKLLASRVLQQCDELDGVKDSLIFKPEACRFDPAVLKCDGEKTGSCLSAAQVDAVKKIFAGPKTSAGRALYSDWPYDSGIADQGWRAWILGNARTPANGTMIFPAFINGVALKGSAPPIDFFAFNFNTDPVRINKASNGIDALSADLSKFRKRGGKLLLYTGMSDAALSANDLINYYKKMAGASGGMANTWKFARMFLLPGVCHCGGGPGLDDFDALTAIENWVEKETPPASIVVSGTAFPGRTRPLCPYPQIPRYKGAGNTEDAANFECR